MKAVAGKGTVEFSTGDEVFWKEEDCEIVLDGNVVFWKRGKEMKTAALSNCLITWDSVPTNTHTWYSFWEW